MHVIGLRFAESVFRVPQSVFCMQACYNYIVQNHEELIMTTAIFAGSFDPVTNGHYDILKQASEMFDKVIIAIAYNPAKSGFLPVEERLSLINLIIKDFDNVESDVFDGLTVNYAEKRGADVLIRGIRNSADFEYENKMAQVNHLLNAKIKTVFLIPKPENMSVSSSVVREILDCGGDISKFVPEKIKDYFE